MKQSSILLLGLVSMLFFRCELINPEEIAPAYLHIEAFRLQTDINIQGSASEKITEVWVTVNNEFLGVYQLPATLPVLMNGEVDLFLEAGIKENGIGSTPQIYPFYQPYETSIDLIPEQTVTVSPTTSYSRDTRFALIEDFESGMTVFRDTLFGNSGLSVSNSNVFEGNFSGKLQLDQDNQLIELATSFTFASLTDRSPLVYLEIDYRSDVPVIFGLVGNNNNGTPDVIFDPGFNPKDSWNKIYFNLSGLLATSPYNRHQLALRAYIPVENGQLTLNNATVCLDNIKLVHF